jgi:hypothetical protein
MAEASGTTFLDPDDGSLMLDTDGSVRLADGVSDDCCCGGDCCECGDCYFPCLPGDEPTVTVSVAATLCRFEDAECTDLYDKSTHAGTGVLSFSGYYGDYMLWEGYFDHDVWIDESPTSCNCELTGYSNGTVSHYVRVIYQCATNRWIVQTDVNLGDMWQSSNGGFWPDFAIPGDCDGGEATTPVVGSLDQYDEENDEWYTIYYACRYTPRFYSKAIAVASIAVNDNDCMAV